jgi:hypothetical protein
VHLLRVPQPGDEVSIAGSRPSWGMKMQRHGMWDLGSPPGSQASEDHLGGGAAEPAESLRQPGVELAAASLQPGLASFPDAWLPPASLQPLPMCLVKASPQTWCLAPCV